MNAEEFFTKEWGTGFHDATLSSDKGLLQMSMEDVYKTMEQYAQSKEGWVGVDRIPEDSEIIENARNMDSKEFEYWWFESVYKKHTK